MDSDSMDKFDGNSKFTETQKNESAEKNTEVIINMKECGIVEEIHPSLTKGIQTPKSDELNLENLLDTHSKQRERKKNSSRKPAPKKLPQVVFNIKPYNIPSLKNFLEGRIEKAKRTHQGTQTMQSEIFSLQQQNGTLPKTCEKCLDLMNKINAYQTVTEYREQDVQS